MSDENLTAGISLKQIIARKSVPHLIAYKPYNAVQLLKTVRNLLDSDVNSSLQVKKH